MRNMIFRAYLALMTLIASSLACLVFAFRLGNWARDDFNTSQIGLAISFIIAILSYKAHHKYGLRFCAICGQDLTEGNGLLDGKPCIRVVSPSGRLIGAACVSCHNAQK